MKKFFKNKVLIFSVVFIVIIGACLTFLCLRQPDLTNLVKSNLSDYRDAIYFVECQDFKANFMCGVREEPYEYNGIKNRDREFGVVSVVFPNVVSLTEISFKLTVDGKSFSGVLEKNPFDDSFMADIEKRFDETKEISLCVASFNEVKLNAISKDWKITADKALEIGINYLKDEMEDFITQNKLYGECYLKVITDEKMEKFYWCFSFVGDDLKMRNVAINTDNGEVLIKSVT